VKKGNLFRFSINAKIATSYIVIIIILILSGAGGLLGVGALSKTLLDISGPLWNSSYAAMQGMVGVQSSMISMYQLLARDIDEKQENSDLKEANAMLEQAFKIMVQSQKYTPEEILQIENLLNDFRDNRNRVVSKNIELHEIRSKAEQDLAAFDDLLMKSEQSIRELMRIFKEMDMAIEEQFDGILAAMDTRIALLRRSHAFGALLTGGSIEQQTAEMAKWFERLDKNISYLLESPFVTEKIEKGSDVTFMDAIDAAYNRHQKLFSEAVELYKQYVNEKMKLKEVSRELLTMGKRLENNARSDVTTVMGGVGNTISDANNMIYISIFLGLIIAVTSYLLIKKQVVQPVQAVAKQLIEISEGEGDLTVMLDNQRNDELGELARGFNGFVAKTREAIIEVSNTVNRLNNAVTELGNVTDETTGNVAIQQDETNQAAAAVNQMSSTSQEMANQSKTALNLASEADRAASTGQHVVAETINDIIDLANKIDMTSNAIQELGDETINIGTVLEVIKGIADQTNLLALNAAIEAARAGEQGRGFAVVADEVRKLASNTQSATQEINDMITRLQNEANEAVESMKISKNKAQDSVIQAKEAGNALQIITNAVSQIHDMNTYIANASNEQSTVSEMVNRNVARINEMSDNNTNSTHKISDAAHELGIISTEMQTLVGQFRV
jgi:methyl-accepting chemotaxis protein